MNSRKALYPIEKLLLERWSPRAMSGEPISHETFLRLIEAARWAPSSYNNQPWRFVYAHRDTKAWERLFNLMVSFNQGWTKNAAVLVVMISKNVFDYNGKPSRTHSFDAGAAWENLALQGFSMGLVVHGMEGFDYAKAYKDLNISEKDYTVEAMCAIGKPGKISDLPADLQEREKPSDRRPFEEILFEGSLK